MQLWFQSSQWLRDFLRSLRFRLMCLVLLTLAPVLGLVCYAGWKHRQEDIASLERQCAQVVQLAAQQEEEMVNGTRQLLAALSYLPQVRGCDTVACKVIFAELIKQNPRYSNWGLIRTNGEVACTARPLAGQICVADRSYFLETLRTRNFAMGDYQVDRATGLPTWNFGYPVLNEKGEVTAVIFAALDLNWVNQFESSIQTQLPPRATWTKIDERGIIIFRHPDPERWRGKPVPQQSLLETVLRQPNGVMAITNWEGTPSFYAFASTRSPLFAWKVHVILGVPKQVLLADSWRMESRNLALLGFIGGLALAVGWIGSDLLLVRRVKALVSSTTKLAAGDLSVRTEKSPRASELDQLADAFDRMAATLEQHETKQARAQEALRQSEEKFRRIVDTANEGICVFDQNYRTTFANRRIAEMLGYEVDEMTGRGLDSFLFKEDLADYTRRVENRRRGLPEQYECRHRRKDGEPVWTLVSATPLHDNEGRFCGSFAMMANITERMHAEEALRELSGQLLRLQDEERRNVARELHDHAAQWLAALAMNLTSLDSLLPASNAKAKKLLSESLKLLEQCSLEVRTLSYLLHPPLLDELGLAGAIEEYTDEFARRSGLRVDVDLPPDLGRLPKDAEMALFRVLQESLINVHRHSGSSTARVHLTKDADEIRLEVIDAGHGMGEPGSQGGSGQAPQRLGVGITGMRERLRQLGGKLEIESCRQGATIRARVPLKKESHEHIANSGGR